MIELPQHPRLVLLQALILYILTEPCIVEPQLELPSFENPAFNRRAHTAIRSASNLVATRNSAVSNIVREWTCVEWRPTRAPGKKTALFYSLLKIFATGNINQLTCNENPIHGKSLAEHCINACLYSAIEREIGFTTHPLLHFLIKNNLVSEESWATHLTKMIGIKKPTYLYHLCIYSIGISFIYILIKAYPSLLHKIPSTIWTKIPDSTPSPQNKDKQFDVSILYLLCADKEGHHLLHYLCDHHPDFIRNIPLLDWHFHINHKTSPYLNLKETGGLDVWDKIKKIYTPLSQSPSTLWQDLKGKRKYKEPDMPFIAHKIQKL